MNSAEKSSVPIFVQDSPVHGKGLFAKRTILPGERIIEYVGERISKQESLRRCQSGNECIFALDDETDVDGNVEWNPARFINHSCSPNCRAERACDGIWIVADREIAAGEEITFNYSYDLEDFSEHPCRCGSENCVGYIVADELAVDVRRQLARELTG